MFGFLTRALLLLSTSTLLANTVVVADHDTHSLPIVFIHGLTGSAALADSLKANLSTDARPLVALTSCEKECSTTERNHQVDLHIAKLRELVASDARYANGYTLIGHSQGGAIARGVIENMDDHKVHTFISLAGAGNGVFYGPQPNDFVPAKVFLSQFSQLGVLKEYNYSGYTDADITSGKLQIDLIKFYTANPQYDNQLARSPIRSDWAKYSTFLPRLNNVQSPTGNVTIAAEQARRKSNFLRVKQVHYFGSPFDEVISPWQSALNGQYNDVATLAELERDYSKLHVLSMTETLEYQQDLYGLQTLDKRGALFLHEVEHVSHMCWVIDETSARDGQLCKFQDVYEKTYYPLLAPKTDSEPVKGHC